MVIFHCYVSSSEGKCWSSKHSIHTVDGCEILHLGSVIKKFRWISLPWLEKPPTDFRNHQHIYIYCVYIYIYMYISYIYIYLMYIYICDMNQLPRLNWMNENVYLFRLFQSSSHSIYLLLGFHSSQRKKIREFVAERPRKWWTGLPLLLAIAIIAHIKNDKNIPRKSIPCCSCWLNMGFCLVLGENSPNEWPGFAYPEWGPWCFIGLLGWISILLCLTII